MSEKDRRQLLRILEDSYVLDMYVGRVKKNVSPHFHAAFQILLPSFDGRSGQITDAEWWKPDLSDTPPPKAIQPDQHFNCSVLDITGKAAVCKVEAIRDGRLRYTDYVTFLKINREWKVVGKVFHQHFAPDNSQEGACETS